MTRPARRSRAAAALAPTALTAAALALVCAGCAREEKVIRYKPFLANLPEAKTGFGPVGVENPMAESLMAQGDRKIVVEGPDGRVYLISKTVRDLMSHIERTLDMEQDALFIDQVLSARTKAHLAEQGQTPEQFLRILRQNRRDIALFFNRVPFGEHSPTAVFKVTGKREYVLRITGQHARGLRFTELWVALEDGHFRLMWIA